MKLSSLYLHGWLVKLPLCDLPSCFTNVNLLFLEFFLSFPEKEMPASISSVLKKGCYSYVFSSKKMILSCMVLKLPRVIITHLPCLLYILFRLLLGHAPHHPTKTHFCHILMPDPSPIITSSNQFILMSGISPLSNDHATCAHAIPVTLVRIPEKHPWTGQ